MLISLWAVTILVLGILTAGLVSLDAHYTRQATMILQAVVIVDLIWYLPALKFMQAAYEARAYLISNDEIIIQSGWWTKYIRHIPLSSVVAVEMRWDRLDRWLEIGSLDVQTVIGRNGRGSRVRLAGLADVELVAQMIFHQLQCMRDERLAIWAFHSDSPESSRLSFRHQH